MCAASDVVGVREIRTGGGQAIVYGLWEMGIAVERCCWADEEQYPWAVAGCVCLRKFVRGRAEVEVVCVWAD